MDITSGTRHVYYIPKYRQCLCGVHFEPIYDAHFDIDDGFYAGIDFDLTDEHCCVCVQSAED